MAPRLLPSCEGHRKASPGQTLRTKLYSMPLKYILKLLLSFAQTVHMKLVLPQAAH